MPHTPSARCRAAGHLLSCDEDVVPSEDTLRRPLAGVMGPQGRRLACVDQETGNTKDGLWAKTTKLANGVRHD